MKYKVWVEQKRGRAAALAGHFGVTQGFVSQWKTLGVPMRYMRAVCGFTGGDVTLEELVPEHKSAVKNRPAKARAIKRAVVRKPRHKPAAARNHASRMFGVTGDARMLDARADTTGRMFDNGKPEGRANQGKNDKPA